MQDVCWLLFLIPVLSARSFFGPVYEKGRPRLPHQIILIRSDVQDGRSWCNVTDVLGRFDASACDLPLPDIKEIGETDQKKIITMCFGLYDLLYELCSFATGNRAVGNVLNGNFRESQKSSDFCVEAGQTQFTSIRHRDPILDKWADYLKNLLLQQKSCEELCQLQYGVHIICKLIIAGHRYLSMPSDGLFEVNDQVTLGTEDLKDPNHISQSGWAVGKQLSPRLSDFPDRAIIPVIVNETVNEKLETSTQSKNVEDASATTSVPVSIHVVNEDTSHMKAESTSVFADVDATKNMDSGVKATKYHEWISTEEKKEDENNLDGSCEELSTKKCVGKHGGHQVEGAGGLGIWFAVFIVVTLLTVIVLVARFIRKEAVDWSVAARTVFRWRRSFSHIEHYEI